MIKGLPVYLMDLMPEHDLVADYVQKYVTRQLLKKNMPMCLMIMKNGIRFRQPLLKIISGIRLRPMIQNPPYFDGLADDLAIQPLKNLAVLAKFGDTVTTDHISPAGNIARNSPAASYLLEHGVDYQEFNSYGEPSG